MLSMLRLEQNTVEIHLYINRGPGEFFARGLC